MILRRREVLASLASSALLAACSHDRGHPPAPSSAVLPDAPPVLDLAPRPAGAETGSAFFQRVLKLGPVEYEAAVERAIEDGNVPPFERTLARVELGGEIDGARVTIAVFVIPDYLAIGGDDDFVRAPMLAKTAQRMANRRNAVLPTRKLVDAIYKAAPQKFSPIALGAGPDMNDRGQFVKENDLIEKQRKDKGYRLGPLSAGDKKDIILTNQLADHKDRVAIYGFQQEDGTPIQPLSVVHGLEYEDYSHGVRLVSQRALVDGAWRFVEELYQDPKLSVLLSDEGPLKVVRYP